MNLAVTETIKIKIEIAIFQFFSLSDIELEFVKKYKEKIIDEEQIWKSWGLAVDERNSIIGEVKINKK